MSELAKEHAESVAQGIRDNVESGYPFGKDEEREQYGEQAELSAYDYLEDALDIVYSVDSNRVYRGARVLVSWGGPNVYIDTNTNALEVYWGSDTATRYLPAAFIDALDEALLELWEMGA